MIRRIIMGYPIGGFNPAMAQAYAPQYGAPYGAPTPGPQFAPPPPQGFYGSPQGVTGYGAPSPYFSGSGESSAATRSSSANILGLVTAGAGLIGGLALFKGKFKFPTSFGAIKTGLSKFGSLIGAPFRVIAKYLPESVSNFFGKIIPGPIKRLASKLFGAAAEAAA
jgi:hypothetical protein